MNTRSDARDRVKEALVKLLSAALLRGPPAGADGSAPADGDANGGDGGGSDAAGAWWLNPGEEEASVPEALGLLGDAIAGQPCMAANIILMRAPC